jgi:hypothetical protein
MNWLNRGIQEKVLRVLSDNYPDCLKATEIYNSLFPGSHLPVHSDVTIDKKTWEPSLICGIDKYIPYTATLQSDEFQYFLKNIYYLEESGLIEITSIDSLHKNFDCKINHKGIDSLTDDGGLSSILGVVTVKLHSDTIQALLDAKINEANISSEEKSRLKGILSKMGDVALAKFTEKAIDAVTSPQIINLLQSL